MTDAKKEDAPAPLAGHVTAREIARHYAVSTQTLHALRVRGKITAREIPTGTFGRRVVYDAAAIHPVLLEVRAGKCWQSHRKE